MSVNGPPVGAPGLGSHVSSWLEPPVAEDDAFVGVLECLIQTGLSEVFTAALVPISAHRADASEKRAPTEIVLS